MSGTMEILIREMAIEDYEAVYHLWTEIRGFGIRSIQRFKLEHTPAPTIFFQLR